jgi:hypothetical protein
MRKVRTTLWFSIAILVMVATGTGYVHNVAIFWFCMGLIVVLVAAAICTLEPVSSRILGQTPSQTGSSPRAQVLIQRWRNMVSEIHAQMLTRGNRDSIASLLEAHSTFPSIRPFLSERSQAAIWGSVSMVPPDQSSMPDALHSILEDIDRMEEKWGMRQP